MIRELRISVTTILASSLLIFATSAGAQIQSPITPNIEGTTWEVTDSDKQSYIFEFQKGAKLRYVSSNGITGKGSWKQTGNSIYIAVNGKFVEYIGAVEAGRIEGDAKSRKGRKLKWSGVKEQAMVVTPNAPRYPPIAAAAHATGTVIVEVKVDPKGTVTSATTIDGHPLLRKICEASAKQWQFNSAGGNMDVRTVRLLLSFSLLPPDCKNDVIELPPVYISSYLVNVRRRKVCLRY
jgi:TonB family protein